MKIIVTGAHGYVGSLITAALKANEWSVKTLKTADESSWRLLNDLPKEQFCDTTALVHAAWDMRFSSKKEAFMTNVIGSRKLIQQAIQEKVKKLIFISTMSAYEGCSSHYGQMKLLIEKEVLDAGGIVVRPGLVFGSKEGGMVGKLLGLVKKLSIIPLPCASAKQYLVNDKILTNFICQVIEGGIAPGLYSLANPIPLSMKEIILHLAASLGKKAWIIPVPWQLAWLGLFFAQILRLQLSVNTDNLIGLARANPHPDFSALENLNIQFSPSDNLF